MNEYERAIHLIKLKKEMEVLTYEKNLYEEMFISRRQRYWGNKDWIWNTKEVKSPNDPFAESLWDYLINTFSLQS